MMRHFFANWQTGILFVSLHMDTLLNRVPKGAEIAFLNLSVKDVKLLFQTFTIT
jgi:N-acetylmuramoyl-L-alanine amidase